MEFSSWLAFGLEEVVLREVVIEDAGMWLAKEDAGGG